jgi:5-formyltetrahydrofolate cyclo-ligase
MGGEGYSDLEFAILRELGHPPVPVATTVHDLQVVASVPQDPTDQPLSAIATPTRTIRIKRPGAAPTGIDWTRLSAADLQEMPILADLKRMVPGPLAKPGRTRRPRLLAPTAISTSGKP